MCLRIVTPENGETGAFIHSFQPSMTGLAHRDTSSIHLLTDEHSSAAQEKAECEYPAAQSECGTPVIVHGIVHHSSADVRWLKGT